MTKSTRTLLMVLAAVATGFLLWIAAQFDAGTTGGYWAALALIAFGGLLLGLSQHRGGESSPRWVRVLVFLPASLVALWAIVVAQPEANTYRDHLVAWDSDLGISGAVHSLGLWNGVLALGVGLFVGLALEPSFALRRQPAVASAPVPAPASDPLVEPDSRIAVEPVVEEPEPAGVTDIGASPESRRVGPAAGGP